MTLLAVTGLRREARIAARTGVTAISIGGDAESLTAQLATVPLTQIRGIVSFGIAAALSPDLTPGDFVVAERVIAGDQVFPTDGRWLAAVAGRFADGKIGSIAGTAKLLSDADEKTRLHEATGADAADMESHLAAEAAQARNLPFLAIRAISDAADRDLPPAACAALRPDGSLDAWAIARSIVSRPAQIPALLRTGRETERAFAALLRCLDMLGRGFAFPDLG